MVNFRRKTRASQSRSASRARSTSRARSPPKTRSTSKSPARKSVPNVSRSKSPVRVGRPKRMAPATPFKTEGSSKLASPARRSSLRLIEKVGTATVELGRPSVPKKVLPFKSVCFLGCAAKLPVKILLSVFSSGTVCFFASLIVPLFVYWSIFLALAPTGENTFSIIRTSHGESIVIFGAALPFDLELLNPLILFGVAVFTRLTILLHALIPLGKTSTVIADGQRLCHRCNGALVFSIYVIAAALYQYRIAGLFDGPHLHDLSNYIPSIFLAVVLEAFGYALHVFLKEHLDGSVSARIRRPRSFLVDFYRGCGIRPVPYGVDIKMVSEYICFIGGFALQVASGLRQYQELSTLSLGLMILIFLHFTALLDFFVYEPTALHCHDVLRYGCGLRWFQTKFIIRPLLGSIGVFYLSHNYHIAYPSMKPLPDYTLPVLGAIFFVIGLFVRRRAINQRFIFRCAPQHLELEGMHILRAESGSRILAGGWWGFVRHPDYLGELLLSIGLALPTGFGNFAPWIVPIFVFLDVLLRIHWDEQVCSEKYDLAWKKYTVMVPYRLFRGVY